MDKNKSMSFVLNSFFHHFPWVHGDFIKSTFQVKFFVLNKGNDIYLLNVICSDSYFHYENLLAPPAKFIIYTLSAK